MKKSTAVLLAFLAFFSGAFVGLAMAPIKGMFGSNNGNTTNHFYGPKNDFHGDESDDCASDDIDDLAALDGEDLD